MFYIRLLTLIAFIFITACTQPVQDDATSSPGSSEAGAKSEVNISDTTAQEIAIYRQAITELNNGKYENAKKSLFAFVKDRPELAGPWANLGLIYIKQDKLEKAEEYLNKALERNPNMPQALNLMGLIENKKGNIIKAKSFYSQAIKYKPDYAIAHYNLALIYDIYLQDIQNALIHYKRYLQLTNNADTTTKNWVEQLQNSLNRG